MSSNNRQILDLVRQDRSAIEGELSRAGAKITGDKCTCPFHEDNNPSGSLFSKKGIWYFKCHAGSCGIGGDVFDLQARRENRGVKEVISEYLRNSTGQSSTHTFHSSPIQTKGKDGNNDETWESMEGWGQTVTARMGKKGYALVNCYPYGEDKENPIMASLRFEHPTKGKTFRQAHRRNDGLWVNEGMPAPRPMFNLRLVRMAVKKHVSIVICEGEKAALAAHAAGKQEGQPAFIATTSIGGSNAVGYTDWSTLAGAKDVVIWPDADDSGRKGAEMILRLLASLDTPPQKVRMVYVDDFNEGADAADLSPEEVRTRIHGAKEMTLPNPIKPQGTREPVITRMSEVVPEPIEWLWPGRLAIGKLHLLAGDPGMGKSTVALDIAARISSGNPWPFHDHARRTARGVVILAAEDAMADTIRPRLDAAGADVHRIICIAALRQWGQNGQSHETGMTLADLSALEEATKKVENCALILIDPISAYFGKADSHKDTEVRALLAPLGKLAERLKVAILLVAHLNKSANGKAAYRVGGSIGIIAAARVAHAVVKDRENPSYRVIAQLKDNLSKDSDAIVYRLTSCQNNPEHPMVDWVKMIPNANCDDLLCDANEHEDNGGSSLDEAMLDAFSSATDGVGFARLLEISKSIGAYSDKATRKSLKRIGAAPVRIGFGKDGKWQWSLKP